MDLSHSKDLIKMPDFKVVPNLKRLNLEGCTKLVQIDPSIGHLRKLVHLNLESCTSLVGLPDTISGLSSLEDLKISGCTKLLQIDPSIGRMRKLVYLILESCTSLVGLPDTISGLSSLEDLNLSGCTKVLQIHPSIGHLRKLVDLNLEGCTSLVGLPDTISGLSSLEVLNLGSCTILVDLPDIIFGLSSLEGLNLSGCTKLVQIHPSIGHLRKLVYLNLENCTSLVSLPNSILGLSSLQVLNFAGCSKLFNCQHLEKPRHKKRLKLDIREGCQSASSISERLSISSPFGFFFAKRHEDSAGLSLPALSCLMDLDLSFCNLFQIPDAIMRLHCLERLNLGGNHFDTLPYSIMELPKLITLDLVRCKQLRYLQCPSSTILPARRGLFRGKFASGLHKYNCPKLSGNEGCSNMAFSWIIKVLQGREEFLRFIGQIDVVVPGTQIPRWFENQNVGESISIKPSPIVHDSNWIGLACCALFVIHSTDDLDDYSSDDPDDHSTHDPDDWNPCFAFKFGGGINYRGEDCVLALEKEDLVTDGLGHLFLKFICRQGLIDVISYLTKGDFRLCAYVDPRPRGLRVEVKKIGWRWVFEQDVEELQSNPTMMPSNDFRGDGPALCLESRN